MISIFRARFMTLKRPPARVLLAPAFAIILSLPSFAQQNKWRTIQEAEGARFIIPEPDESWCDTIVVMIIIVDEGFRDRSPAFASARKEAVKQYITECPQAESILTAHYIDSGRPLKRKQIRRYNLNKISAWEAEDAKPIIAPSNRLPNGFYVTLRGSGTDYFEYASVFDKAVEKKLKPVWFVRSKVDENWFYSVRVGPFNSEQLALAAAQQIRKCCFEHPWVQGKELDMRFEIIPAGEGQRVRDERRAQEEAEKKRKSDEEIRKKVQREMYFSCKRRQQEWDICALSPMGTHANGCGPYPSCF